MKTNDIAIAYISWPGGGKRRPIFIIYEQENIIHFYKITSKYESKSSSIQKKYFKIKHWGQAGLKKQSYIDTITVGEIDKRKFNLKLISKLTEEDAKELTYFLARTKQKSIQN